MTSMCLPYFQTAISVVVGMNTLQVNGKVALEDTDVIRLSDTTNANTLVAISFWYGTSPYSILQV
jgi:hypothetical protein